MNRLAAGHRPSHAFRRNPAGDETPYAVAKTLKYICAAASFLGAFLLLQIQPLISKAILPWFGGSPAVWTTAMVVFQLLLTVGYSAVHLSRRYFAPATRSYMFLVAAAASLATLPILPDASWKHSADASPILTVLLLLLVCVGPTYFVLSLTGPLMQEWYVRSRVGDSPYRLYALSNTGSLLGLLTYPFVFEPIFDLRQQAMLWTTGFVIYCGLTAWGAWQMRGYADEASFDRNRSDDAPKARLQILGWIGLAAAGTFMLSAATNYLNQDVPAMPLLWVVPLAAYLISFILCFGWDLPRLRAVAAVCLIPMLPLACVASISPNAFAQLPEWLGETLRRIHDLSYLWHFCVVNAVLFLICLLAHGELAARKPGPQRLTSYYLCMSVGGALGGLFVGVIAPLIYSRYWEWMFGTTAALFLAAASVLASGIIRSRSAQGIVVGLAVLGGGSLIWIHSQHFNSYEVDAARNFYGVVCIDAATDDDGMPLWLAMRHGSTRHGMQITEPGQSRVPTSYYGIESGIGLTLLAARELNRPLRVGVVGLGAGTLAAYGRPGDEFRFYEINPAVAKFADEYFSFLRESPAKCEIVLGDARLSLEREPVGLKFDLLVLDAFSGDAVPTHLLTSEAFDIYLQRLRDDGILAVHISNRHLNLSPVMVAAADQWGLVDLSCVSVAKPESFVDAARWTLLTRDGNSAWWKSICQTGRTSENHAVRIAPWTDVHCNIFELLKGSQ